MSSSSSSRKRKPCDVIDLTKEPDHSPAMLIVLKGEHTKLILVDKLAALRRDNGQEDWDLIYGNIYAAHVDVSAAKQSEMLLALMRLCYSNINLILSKDEAIAFGVAPQSLERILASPKDELLKLYLSQGRFKVPVEEMDLLGCGAVPPIDWIVYVYC